MIAFLLACICFALLGCMILLNEILSLIESIESSLAAGAAAFVKRMTEIKKEGMH